MRAIPGIGQTRASKLLARKRPHLLPIIDSVVSGALGLGNAGSWSALQVALGDAPIRSAIDGMAPTMDGPAPTTLRLLAVATWMRFSESDNARDVRRSLGLPVKARKPTRPQPQKSAVPPRRLWAQPPSVPRIAAPTSSKSR